MLQFSCRFACYHVVVSQTADRQNACMFLLELVGGSEKSRGCLQSEGRGIEGDGGHGACRGPQEFKIDALHSQQTDDRQL